MRSLSRVALATVLAIGLASAVACSRAAAPPPPTWDVTRLVGGGSPFHGVHGLRVGWDGTLYAVSVIGQSVYAVNPGTGAVTTFVGPPNGMGDDIAIAPDDGTFVWTAIEDGIVHARAPNGTLRRLMEGQKGVNAVSFSRDGTRLFVSLVFYGDALYELDRSGARPPRRILENIGGLNGFEVGADGMIYGPLWFKNQVVRIDPDTGELMVIADGFSTPAALKLDFKGSAYVLDSGTRRVLRVDLQTGQKTPVATLPHGVDNLAFDATRTRLFVSLSAVNGIAEVNVATGAVRDVVKPAALTSPTGLAVMTANGADTIYLGDLFGGVKTIDGQTGAVRTTPVEIFQPAHVSATDRHLIVVSQVFGAIQRIDRANFARLDEWSGLKSPGDALEAPNGDIFVAETGSGSLLRIAGPAAADRKPVVTGLGGPLGLAWAGPNTVYVTETSAGLVSRIDIGSGSRRVIAEGLANPEGIAVTADGELLVVEVGARRIVRISPPGGDRTIVAANLPIGLSYGPSLYRGIAVTPSAIYINSDIENAIYRLTLP